MMRALVGLLLVYLGVCLVLKFFENSLVYRPTLATQHWQEKPTSEIQDVELTSADGTSIHAWWLPCPGADEALLYLHGNAGNLSHRGRAIVELREWLGVSVLIIDYPGYGKSSGRPTEQGCYDAGEAAYAWLVDQRKIAPEKILLYGGSLGGGIAVDLASRKPHRALILAKTFTSTPDVAANLYPWLPVRWLMSNRFDNLAKISRCHRPVFIGHGDVDDLIPFAHGQRLFTAANEPKHFVNLVGSDHNAPLPQSFFAELKQFLAANP
jgi:fermentation-respiration switch protein FrsA (DUF1100 family)